MKTSELSKKALDWAVAMALGLDENDYIVVDNLYGAQWKGPEFSEDWGSAGPIIEYENISLEYILDDKLWVATRIENNAVCEAKGNAPLLAAMRCYTISQLGDNIDVPQELKEQSC